MSRAQRAIEQRKPALRSVDAFVSLTLAERDAIDTAKGRSRRLVGLVGLILNTDYDLIDDDEREAGLADLLDIVTEDLQRIDAVFEAVDARRLPGGAR